jgi:hypothetical protein
MLVGSLREDTEADEVPMGARSDRFGASSSLSREVSERRAPDQLGRWR